MLIINKKEFKTPKMEELVYAIIEMANLPEPEIASFDSPSIEEDEVVLCLQREMAYVDSLNPASKIRYMGSKSVETCLVAFFTDGNNNHGIVHVDSFKNLDLIPLLSCFNNQKNIYVYLAGGSAVEKRGISDRNLITLLNSLLKASEKLKLTIEIKSQKIIDRNLFLPECKYQVIYDQFIHQIEMLCRQLFDTPLDKKNDLKHFSVKDFRTKIVKGSLEYETNLLLSAFEVYDENFSIDEISELKRILDDAKNLYKTKTAFLEAIKKMFSIQGFTIFETKSLEWPEGCLINFAFDITTNKIHIINESMRTPNEERRALYLQDIKKASDYFLCYDGRSLKWLPFNLSNEAMAWYTKILSTIKNNVISEKELEEIPGIELNPGVLHPLIKNFRYFIKNSSFISPHNKSLFFKSGDEFGALYEKNYSMLSLVNQYLFKLNDITGLVFHPKLRLDSDYVIDAFFEFDSLNEAEKIQTILDEFNIKSTVMIINECRINYLTINEIKIKGRIHSLCVPSINVGLGATSISQTWKKKFGA